MTTHSRTTTERGYGTQHQQLRARIAAEVNAGHATCWRCHKPIRPIDNWDLGHDDYDRSKYNGPEHAACNRGATKRNQTTHPVDTSRNW